MSEYVLTTTTPSWVAMLINANSKEKTKVVVLLRLGVKGN